MKEDENTLNYCINLGGLHKGLKLSLDGIIGIEWKQKVILKMSEMWKKLCTVIGKDQKGA